jgi:hypothetical protein
MSYYVKRSGGRLGYAYVGPIRAEKQAHKEAEAWISCGHTAEVLESSPAVRADVRAWDKTIHAIRFGTFPGSPLYASSSYYAQKTR